MSKIPPEFDIEYYSYILPEHLIAYYPAEKREESRLLAIERTTGKLRFHEKFSEILKYFRKGDLLVLNDTKVFPARLKGRKKTGGEVEILLFKKPSGVKFQTEALLKGKRLKEGTLIELGEGFEAEVLARFEGGRFLIELRACEPLEKLLVSYGKAPLPPYIKREPERLDLLRYQTVYARKEGAVAAPTAGFHFTEELLKELKKKGIELAFITLHVGYGTFAPVKVRDIREHRVEPEYIEVDEKTAKKIKEALEQKRRIIAVGTTVVRTLEFLALRDFAPYKGLCDLYIYPGFKFKVVSAMVTNFHLPKSSLFLLVCAFAGRELMLKAYEEAIKRKYRFYSYGDATFIY